MRYCDKFFITVPFLLMVKIFMKPYSMVCKKKQDAAIELEGSLCIIQMEIMRLLPGH